MRLRRHPARPASPDAVRSNDDGGGQGAEYVDGGWSGPETDEDSGADRTAWRRAHHWTPDRNDTADPAPS